MITSIKILNSEIILPLQFSSPLPFSASDIQKHPWLSKRIRYYSIQKEVGKGGRATAYLGHVSDETGERIPDTPQIVIKIPNLDPDGKFTISEIQSYLANFHRECTSEWMLTKSRLHDCKHANVIFDFDTILVEWLGELMPVPVSVQLWLGETRELDRYLVETGHRNKPYHADRGKPIDNWMGIQSAQAWIKISKSIARGLADIHRRRVVHGDIWPPNIFMCASCDGDDHPIFIDFGEAFPLEPRGEAKTQRDHAYRAPERVNSNSIVNQQCDVYSFGKLLLHLATGEEPILDPKTRGHQRREKIRKSIQARNPILVNENPFIMDLICMCIAVDPIGRPSMDEVVQALNTFVDFNHWRSEGEKNIEEEIDGLKAKWNSMQEDAGRNNYLVSNSFREIIYQRISEVYSMIENLKQEVIVFRDTRERLMQVLLGLFQDLKEGDCFVSVTSPNMWQESALGIEGRYFTANVLAAMRGAFIRRVFVISIQELGHDWSLAFADKLRNTENPSLVSLANTIENKASSWRFSSMESDSNKIPESSLKDNRQRLAILIRSHFEFIHIFEYKNDVFDNFKGVNSFLGLLVCGSIHEVNELKSKYPVSLFSYQRKESPKEYILMMTDCAGRNYGSLLQGTKSSDLRPSNPELKGLTIFKSIFGIPEQRIKDMNQVFRISENIGTHLQLLLEALNSLCSHEPGTNE